MDSSTTPETLQGLPSQPQDELSRSTPESEAEAAADKPKVVRDTASKDVTSFKTFKKCVIVFCGKFGDSYDYKSNVRWAHRGSAKVQTNITPEVTHLVCSEEAYKNDHELVVAARKHKHIKIVNYEWFLYSAQEKRRYAEIHHLMKTVLDEKKQAKREKKKQRRALLEAEKKDYENSEQHAIEVLGQRDNYHIYRDTDGFAYKVYLGRNDLTENQEERYELCLWETNGIPKLYAASMEFHSPKRGKKITILTRPGSFFKDAYYGFKTAFEAKTDRLWEHRYQGDQAAHSKIPFTHPLRSGVGLDTPAPGEQATGVVRPLTVSESDSDLEEDPRRTLRRKQAMAAKVKAQEATATVDNHFFAMRLPDNTVQERSGRARTASTRVGGGIATVIDKKRKRY